MQPRLTQKTAFVTLFLAISTLALAPTLAHANQQYPTSPVAINATGQATAIGNGPSGAATLNLTAATYHNANHWLMMQNTTGSLNIGSTTINIISGQGSVNTYGDIAIFGDTPAGKGQLLLYGTMDGNKINFNPPQSQLISNSYLSLTGTINNQTTPQATTPPKNTTSTQPSTNTTIISPVNQTKASNTTSITSATLPALNTTLTTNVNVTNPASSTQATAVTTSNATDTSSLNIPPNTPVTGNSTVTVTRYVNQTISTTQTVANVTVSYTVTTTVANVTVTQANVTTTVTATTGT